MNQNHSTEFIIELGGKKFYELAVWNMFCCKKSYTIMMCIIYCMSLSSLVMSIPALKAGNRNSFIMQAGVGIVFLVITFYMSQSHVSRYKKIAANDDYMIKTRKRVRMTDSEIVNYRVEAEDERTYSWNDVGGVYNRPDELVISMKDGQMLVMQNEKTFENDRKFVMEKADELHLWKKGLNLTILKIIMAVITVAAVGIGIFLYFR